VNGFDLSAAQGLTEPAEDEEDSESTTNSDAQGRSGLGDVGRSLGQAFGQKSTFALRPPPLQGAQFGGSLGSSFGGSGAVRPPATPPGESDRAQAINAHTANQVAMFHGSRQAPLNGRSSLDYQRATFGAPQGQ
jgi:hypothetical protein